MLSRKKWYDWVTEQNVILPITARKERSMSAKYKDGWHRLNGCPVYLEDGKIVRAMRKDENGEWITAYPYRKSKAGGWDNCTGITYGAFHTAFIRGTVRIF